MGRSYDLEDPDHFTAGAIGPPGQRVFYLQGRHGRTLVTLRCEKEQVRALADYLAKLLARLPEAEGPAPGDPALLEPVEEEWIIGALGAGYDQARDRIVLEARELIEEETSEEAAVARFRLSRAQATAFVERAQALVRAGRPVCPVCSQPKDPAGHVCPRSNGYLARHAGD